MAAKVITIAQQKGGSGKTTLAVHLSTQLAHAGQRVAALDIDPQASLGAWYRLRETTLGDRAWSCEVFPISGWRLQGTLDRLSLSREFVLIDTPPRAESDTRAAIRAARLVLIPVQPSPVDLWATLPTLEVARAERKPVLLVVNRMPSRAILAEEMVGRLGRHGIAVAKTTLGNRTAYAASLAEGLGVVEAYPGTPAALEIAALAEEVLAALG